MADFLNIGNLHQQILKSIAKLCDKNGDGKLEETNSDGVREISIFNQVRFEIKDNRFTFDGVEYNADGSIFVSDNKPSIFRLETLISSDFVQGLIAQALEKKELLIADKVAIKDGLLSNTPVFAPKQQEQKVNTKENFINVVKKYGVNPNDIDYNYWIPMIKSAAEKYKISEEIIMSIIARETHGSFKKHVISPKSDGINRAYGPMQVTKSTTADLCSKYRLDNVYNLLNPQLVQDTLYVEGTSDKKYNNPEQLRNECAKDDELGIKVGILCFESKYIKAVAKLKKVGEKKAISGLQDGSIELSDTEKRQCLREALKLYNGKYSYADDVIESIEKTMEFDISELKTGIIRKTPSFLIQSE